MTRARKQGRRGSNKTTPRQPAKLIIPEGELKVDPVGRSKVVLNTGDQLRPGWGADKLSSFLILARHNQLATFQNKRTAYALLMEIDDCFEKVGTNMLNPKDTITPFFLYRCHSGFRAACATAMAGQSVETFVLERSCLEFAVYGLFIARVTGMGKLWIDRNESAHIKKEMRAKFQLTHIRPVIQACDAELLRVFDTLYEQCIEQGGHPNQRSVMGSLKLTNETDRLTIKQLYMHGDGLVLDVGLKTLVEVGICCLLLLQHCDTLTARYALLGVKERVQALRKNYSALVKPKK